MRDDHRNSLAEIEEKILSVRRIERDEALLLYEEGSFLFLCSLADEVRKRKHPDRVVTYIIDRNINYSNICISGCSFCAFYRKASDPDSYLLAFEEIKRKIGETLSLNGVQILMQGGLHPYLQIGFYEELLRNIKAEFDIHVHAFSPPEIIHIASISALPISETIRRLREAGLDSIPGGGAEILSDRTRKILSPNKCSVAEWLEVMEEAHRQGMKTTATMMFGHIETTEERINHLLLVRELQDKTGGFTAFIPWTFQPGNTRLGGKEAMPHEYLKMLAISRIVLDNIRNIQVSWVTQGDKVAQLALRCGANDFGSTMIEENVVRAAGVSFQLSEEEIVRNIQEAGFIPMRRNMFYERLGQAESMIY
ncbi:MAG: cyclic dehypoxanthinyl futalosine synthase [Acidobacteriota bacterium]